MTGRIVFMDGVSPFGGIFVPFPCDTGRTMRIAGSAADDAGASHPARIGCLIGPDGKIAKVYGKVVPADHPDEVLRDIG